MLNFIDNFLNRITMYRLVLYFLIALVLAGVILGLFGLMPFSTLGLIYSTTVLLAVCLIANKASAYFYRVPANVESVYITALILALIITPPEPSAFMSSLPFLIWVSVLSMASKFILAFRGKHLFNPAALAVAITAVTITQSASWWVGIMPMLPVVLIGGLLVVRKIQRFDLVTTFLGAALIGIVVSSLGHISILTSLERIIVRTPLLFFAFIMLTEPMTTPPRRIGRIIYGALVGFLFIPSLHIGSVYSTPELALLAGNIFAYALSPKEKYLLTLKSKHEVGQNVYELIFQSKRRMKFQPGQYLEWTLGHKATDTRGNRRYFTLASAPTESLIRLGVKSYPNPSSYKRALFSLNPGDQILAGQLSGDFTLPKNSDRKLAFIAGGIGITPFRSMIKYLLDTKQTRDMVLFYSNKNFSEAVYTDVFSQAVQQLGLKTVYTLTDQDQIPNGWQGKVGKIDADMIAEAAPDFKDRTFYVSGPNAMVRSFETVLMSMGVHRTHIKTDFFPGLA